MKHLFFFQLQQFWLTIGFVSCQKKHIEQHIKQLKNKKSFYKKILIKFLGNENMFIVSIPLSFFAIICIILIIN